MLPLVARDVSNDLNVTAELRSRQEPRLRREPDGEEEPIVGTECDGKLG